MSDDGISHTVWCITDSDANNRIKDAFAGIDSPTASSKISQSSVHERFAIVRSVFPFLTDAETDIEEANFLQILERKLHQRI